MGEDKFDVLHYKINERLNKPNVTSSGDNMSLYDLKLHLLADFYKWEIAFVKDVEQNASLINKVARKKNFLSKRERKVPYILAVYPRVNSSLIPEIEVCLCNAYGNYRGKAIFRGAGELFDLDLTTDEFSYSNTVKFLYLFKDFFETTLNYLRGFKEEYPDMEFEWNDRLFHKNAIQDIGDGFIEGHFNLNHLENASCNLQDPDDGELSDKDGPYSELQDYIGMYQKEFMKKTEININDLNPLYHAIVKKSLGKSQEPTLRA